MTVRTIGGGKTLGLAVCLGSMAAALCGTGVEAQLSRALPGQAAPNRSFQPVPSAAPSTYGMQPGGTLFRPGGTGYPNAQLSQFQGGVFPGGGYFSLAPGGTSPLLAFCTDLMSAPPNAETHFVPGAEPAVQLASSGPISLMDALREGLVALRGRDESPNPMVNTGLALRLELVNLSRRPLVVAVRPGATVTPVGQAPQLLPPRQSERLFHAAAARRLTYTNTVQFAVWALRGSTAEDVEQSYLHTLPKSELERVEQLLRECGETRTFDRDRGKYERLYEQHLERLGAEAAEIVGSGHFGNGRKVMVTGRRGEEGSGVVCLRPASGGEFYCAARFEEVAGGKVRVRLEHLVTGRPLHAHRGYVTLKPDRSATARAASPGNG